MGRSPSPISTRAGCSTAWNVMRTRSSVTRRRCTPRRNRGSNRRLSRQATNRLPQEGLVFGERPITLPKRHFPGGYLPELTIFFARQLHIGPAAVPLALFYFLLEDNLLRKV